MIKILLLTLSVCSGSMCVQRSQLMEVFKELNRHRLFNLSYNSSDQAELDRKAKHLETIFGHDHKGLGQPFYSECIWYGRNYREAITDFMKSKGHRKALKDLKAKSVCIGVYQGKESWFVVIRTYD